MLIRFLLGALLLGICLYTDIKYKEIDLKIVLVFAITGIVYAATRGVVLNSLIGMIPGITLIGIAFVSGEAIGYGDGAVLSTVGIIWGIKRTFIIWVMAMIISGLFSLTMFALRKHKLKDEIPWIPFLTAAYFIGVFL